MTKPTSGRKNAPATVYHLDPRHAGMTLAAALKDLVPDTSWSTAKGWIARRQVQVNGNLCLDEARRVTEKDVVKLWKQPLPRPVDTRDLRIVHIDEHLIVVEKPAGVTSVRHFAERKISTRRRQLQPTLEELLPPALAKLQQVRWPPLPPLGMNKGKKRGGSRVQQPRAIHNAKKLPPELQVIPVHRLDRDTSGLMLFARTRLAEQKLTAMFRRHTIGREYVGICLGHVSPQTIETRLVRDRGDGIRGSLPAGDASTDNTSDSATRAASAGAGAGTEVGVDMKAGADANIGNKVEVDVDSPEQESSDRDDKLGSQRAVTHIVAADHFTAGANNQAYSHVRLRLETGRTHQIRIHLAELGHMLCGDKIYFRSAQGISTIDPSGAPRHALHSDRLSFTHPFTGLQMNLTMPLPNDLAKWLKQLRG